MNASPAVATILAALESHGFKPKSTSRGWESKCCSHDDRSPSLGILQLDNDGAFLKCQAGCDDREIMATLNLEGTMHRGDNGAWFLDKDAPPAPAWKKSDAPRKPKTTHATVEAAVDAARFGAAKSLDIPKEQLTYVTRWGYQDAGGKPVAYVARWNLPPQPGEAKGRKHFVPIHAHQGGWRVGDPPQWPLYRLPEVGDAIKHRRRVWWHEGEKAADAMATLGLTCTTTAHGAKSPGKTDFTPMGMCDELIVVADNDDAGIAYARDIARRVMAVAPLVKVRILALPGLPPKGDAVEWIAAYGDAPTEILLADLDRLVAACLVLTEPLPIAVEASPAPPAKSSATKTPADLPQILITPDEHIVVAAAINALAADNAVFYREGVLVDVHRTGTEGGKQSLLRQPGSMTIRKIPDANLRERLTAHAHFVKENAKGDEKHAHPPKWLIEQIQARREWPSLRYLAGVSDSPVLRPDGSIFQAQGYDVHTGVVYGSPLTFPTIPPRPTIDHAKQALAALEEVVCDFSFETKAHLSSWIAALLTPIARFAFEGPAPCFLIDANVRGAGKGLLAHTISCIVSGRPMPICSYAHDPAEMQKVITSIALAGDRMVLLDNIAGSFGNSAMDAALTATMWKGRILGVNLTPELPLSAVWFATGNNVQISGDMCRRTIHIRLNVKEERPENRTGFHHEDLQAWVLQNRPRLLAAALTILAAYLTASRKDAPPMGSFEGWSKVVRGAVMWVGLPDPVSTQIGLAENSDTDGEALKELMDAWAGHVTSPVGIVMADLLAELYPNERSARIHTAVALRSALENVAKGKGSQQPTPRSVGAFLKRFQGRVIDGRYFAKAADKGNAGVRWGLFKTGDSRQVAPNTVPHFQQNNNDFGDSGDSGDSLYIPRAEKNKQIPNVDIGYQGEPAETESLESLSHSPTSAGVPL